MLGHNKLLLAVVLTTVITLITPIQSSVIPPKLSGGRIKEGHIVGGIESDITQTPYQVSVRLDTSVLLHICGGAIYSPRVIITAAHCIKGRFASNIRIVAGTSSIVDDDPGHRVIKLIYHPGYNKKTHVNDVGLIILADPLEYSKTVQPIPLAAKRPESGNTAIISGWGKKDESATTMTNHLQMAEVEIVDREYCGSQYASRSYDITEEMICAGTEDSSKDACQGDSGGPLVVDGKLSGIVSWGIGCAREGFPGVYASVAYHTQWILDNAQPYL
ncbi:trypsin alpha-3-like [Musca vetustissima]|uniref:trypsin alpha-3-like n=1 Tax=Musca vetustissima TaxID=27455 RepID=UPI002AB6FE56|nr:trypsin alpha-3-like [Musca vetustissima]